MKNQTKENRFRGCLVGGAVGDALGYAVEFWGEKKIVNRFGEQGIREYLLQNGVAEISDDTQMTLYTANGLLCCEAEGITDGETLTESIYRCYLDWLKTQNYRMSREVAYSFLNGIPALFSCRAPGGTCLSALESGEMGRVDAPLNNSKGCGGVMRVAPVGLYAATKGFDATKTAKLGATSSAITHGHPLGYLPGAFLACLVRELVRNETTLSSAVATVKNCLDGIYSDSADWVILRELLDKAISLAQREENDLAAIHLLGEGWVGDEALAIALFCALKYADDFEKAVAAAVNHKGDSDSTGAIAGNIVGAYLGFSAIPEKFLHQLELKDTVMEMADDLLYGLPDKTTSSAAYRSFRQKYYRSIKG